MEEFFDELDQQEMHLRRLSRRIDQLSGQLGKTEVFVGQRLQGALERGVARPDGRVIRRQGGRSRWGSACLVSRRSNSWSNSSPATWRGWDPGPLVEEISHDLAHAHERMPITLDAQFYAGPMAVPEEAIMRDFLEVLLNAQQEALLTVDLALDRLGPPAAPD